VSSSLAVEAVGAEEFAVQDGAVILAHLLFFLVRVTEDVDIAIVGRSEKSTIEVVEELLGDLLVP
jgi:hypothetical protein